MLTKCFLCKSNINGIPYRCKYCGLTFCSEHRIPENHSCSFDLRIELNEVIYEDALEFMDQKFTVAKIYEYVTKKELNKAEAIKLLNYFIEKSEKVDDRINSLRAFDLLNLNNKEAYGILENSLLSDENPEVRKTAVKVLIKIFPTKSKTLLKWAINHDNKLNL